MGRESPVVSRRPSLEEWTPVWVHSTTAEPQVEWCHFGQRRLTDPFFSQSAEKAALEPFNLLFRQTTSLDTLIDQSREFPGLPPSGFIFHVSRCGSTLISQMLATSAETVVVSEAAPVEGILRLPRFHSSLPSDRHISLIRALVSTLGRARHQEERFFVKFEPWHCLELPLLRAAFPDAPFLLVFGDPRDILEAQAREASGRMIPNPLDVALAGLGLEIAATMSSHEYRAHIIGIWFRALIKASDGPLTRLLEYTALPSGLFELLPSFWHYEPSLEQRHAMLARASDDAKEPSAPFAARANVREGKIQRAAEPVLPLYRTLREITAEGENEASRAHRTPGNLTR